MKKKYFSHERYAKGNLKSGETFSHDSGMGGSFTMEFLGWDGERGCFRAVNEGWGNWAVRYTPEEAAEALYIITH